MSYATVASGAANSKNVTGVRCVIMTENQIQNVVAEEITSSLTATSEASKRGICLPRESGTVCLNFQNLILEALQAIVEEFNNTIEKYPTMDVVYMDMTKAQDIISPITWKYRHYLGIYKINPGQLLTHKYGVTKPSPNPYLRYGINMDFCEMLTMVLSQNFGKFYAFRIGKTKEGYQRIYANKGKKRYPVPVRTQVHLANRVMKGGNYARSKTTIALQDRRNEVLEKILCYVKTLEENKTLPLEEFLEQVDVEKKDYLLGRKVGFYGLLKNPLHEVNMIAAFTGHSYRCWRVVDPETNDEFVFIQTEAKSSG